MFFTKLKGLTNFSLCFHFCGSTSHSSHQGMFLKYALALVTSLFSKGFALTYNNPNHVPQTKDPAGLAPGHPSFVTVLSADLQTQSTPRMESPPLLLSHMSASFSSFKSLKIESFQEILHCLPKLSC